MPRITKIYTRTGDDGTTALGSRTRVAKDALRVSAYGDVDETSSAIGVALASGLSARIAEALPGFQNDLFHLGSDLAFPEEDREDFPVPTIEGRHIEKLEAFIDDLSEIVGPLENFILPGGSPGAAHLQLARAICRRAERSLVTLRREERVSDEAVRYLNRLSDALFVMARFENYERGVPEPLWDTRA
jgi:cob(I)alamin adenosyltransferase